MSSIGARLRQERLRRGLDLNQIAERTKINPAMLEAIEADDLEKLPGTFFTRSFVRQYAKALDLDEDEFEPELKRTGAYQEPPVVEPASAVHEARLRPIAAPMPGGRTSGGHFSALIAFILIVAVCSVIYTLWQRTRYTSPGAAPQAAASRTPEKPAASRSAAPQPGTATPRPAETSQQAPGTAAQPAPSEAAAPPAGTAPATSAAPAAAAGPVHVEIQAREPVWIRAAADGQYLYSGTLQPSESKSFDGNASLTLRLGDPGAAVVTWNGKPVGEIGPRGMPRTVQFTPEGFRVATAAPPAPPVGNDGL